MIRIARFLKIGQVAAYAGRGRAAIFSTCVARSTVQSCVHSTKRKAATKFQVVKTRALPVINVVALLALGWKSSGDMIGRCSLLESTLVARVTLNRETLKLTDCRTLVTIRAIQSGMATD